MRPFGTAGELEQRRLLAAHLLAGGMSAAEVARRLHVDARSVRRWRAAVRANDRAGLAARPVPGRPRRLTSSDLIRLRWILAAGARLSAMPDGAWSCTEVASVIEWQFGVRYHRAHVNRILHELGIAPRNRC